MKAETLQKKLPKLIEDINLNTDGSISGYVLVDTPSFIQDGVLHVSMEHSVYTGDYYGEFSGGYPTIVGELETFAEDHGMFWEWDNPGSISLYEK
mgnify:FL=1